MLPTEDDDLDRCPLFLRKRLPSSSLLLSPSASDFPGLPRGVKFDPSDEDLVWHLLAKVGKGDSHPLINMFITSLEGSIAIEDILPQKLPGVKQDGSVSYFFHRRKKTFNRNTQTQSNTKNVNMEIICWQGIGKKIEVNVDGKFRGFKKKLVLYSSGECSKLERTDWVMHQYNVQEGEDEQGDIAISKIFYQQVSQKKNKVLQNLTFNGQKEGTFLPERLGQSHHGTTPKLGSTLSPSFAQSKRTEDLSKLSDFVEDIDEEHNHRIQGSTRGSFCPSLSSQVSSLKNDSTECKLYQNNPETARSLQSSTSISETITSLVNEDHWCIEVNLESDVAASRCLSDAKEELQEESCARNSLEAKSHKSNCCPGTLISSIIQDENLHVSYNVIQNQLIPSPCSIEIKTNSSEENHINKFEGTPYRPMCCTLPDSPLPNVCGITQCNLEGNSMQFGEFLEGSNSPGNATVNTLPTDDAVYAEFLPLSSHAENVSSIRIPGSSEGSPARQDCTCTLKASALKDEKLYCESSSHHEKASSAIDQVSWYHEVHSNEMKIPEVSHQNFSACVKEEALEHGLFSSCRIHSLGPMGSDASEAVIKQEVIDEFFSDDIDDIPLKRRMKVLSSAYTCNLFPGNSMELSQVASSSFRSDSLNSRTKQFLLRRKRKRTMTDSVETALEEDAPGLLQILLDKGITVDEIKLYDDEEDDEVMEVSNSKDNFEELETVISKLFSERQSLFKIISSPRNVKGSKAVYCLACLISLVEQSRYLQFRGSPVEWGWSRELQSFIFVFRSHNRIVLERPEYGYATYFFELVESLPIDWQVRRLVAALKLSSCSRVNLIENRPLLVGQDLTEGEAQVLESYGWSRNTGLGRMLNYCGRVVHDRKNESYSSEWGFKIGKLLMAGHDGGRIVLPSIPEKVAAYIRSNTQEIKTETCNTLPNAECHISQIKLET